MREHLFTTFYHVRDDIIIEPAILLDIDHDGNCQFGFVNTKVKFWYTKEEVSKVMHKEIEYDKGVNLNLYVLFHRRLHNGEWYRDIKYDYSVHRHMEKKLLKTANKVWNSYDTVAVLINDNGPVEAWAVIDGEVKEFMKDTGYNLSVNTILWYYDTYIFQEGTPQ